MQPAESRPRRTGWRLGAVLVVLALAGLWSAGWFAAARLAEAGFDRWLEAEAVGGRRWTCPDRRVDGYPLALAIHCTRPTFQGEVAGHPADGIVESLSARLGLDHPGGVVLALGGPLNLRATDESFELVVSWASMAVGLDGVARPVGGTADAARLAVTLATREGGVLNLRAAHLSGSVGQGPDAARDKAFTFSADGVVSPTADAIPGLDGAATASGQGVLSRTDLLRSSTAASLDAWRQAGGRLQLQALAITKGSFSGKASGTLGLDANHRPAGRLDAAVTGFEAIARSFGIPVAGVQLGGLLTNLLGGGSRAPAAPGAIQLPLVLADGRLSVGPFTTGVRLLPLY